MATYRATTLSVTINRDWREVYDYASDPANMHNWAAGLGSNFEPQGDLWLLRDPGGAAISMRFAARNPHGVLDHDVTANGRTTHNAMRVMPNGDGAEFTFLLLQTPDLNDADYQRDAAAVLNDLQTLKRLLEA